jgi:hypothetical protein
MGSLLFFMFLVMIAGACGGHHHHHRRVTHLSCELEETRGHLRRREEDDRTWRPAHILHRVEDIFGHVEEARMHHSAGCLHDVATAHGEAAVAREYSHGRCEPRGLEDVSLSLAVDRPGDCDDAAYVLLETVELDCDRHERELWRLVRGDHREWLLDNIFRGEMMLHELRAAKRALGREGGHTGAVRRVG